MTHSQSHDSQVEALTIWYQQPLRLSAAECEALDAKAGWTLLGPQDHTIGQRTYFHSFAGEPLFGDGSGITSPQFTTLKRQDLHDRDVFLDLIKKTPLAPGSDQKQHTLIRYHARIKSVELRVLTGACSDFLELSVLALELCCDRVTRHDASGMDDLPLNDPNTTSGSETLTLTLADAQDLLEHGRRIFSRRWNRRNQFSDDTLFQVWHLEGGEWSSIRLPKRHEMLPDTAKTPRILPWVECLISPIKWALDTAADSGARHFGDDRAFMFSVLRLRAVEGQRPRDALLALPKGEMFRLAEADGPGDSEYAYHPDFADRQLQTILYDRHAPHPCISADRGTIYMFTERHFCVVTAGSFRIEPNVRKYYRHMQFMCLFEVAALLMFSQRLTCEVRDHASDPERRLDDKAFTRAIRNLREDFLNFTHMHHFTNVSSQIQPREMYEEMKRAVGVEEFYDEVDAEIRSATDHALAQSSLTEAEAANNLQDLLSYGLAIGAVTGLLGMNVLIGQPQTTKNDTLVDDVAILLILVGAVFGLQWLLMRQLKSKNRGSRRIRSPWRFAPAGYLALIAIGVLLIQVGLF